MIKEKAKLDRIFSEFIRLRDANNEGYIQCISCGKVVHWKESDCGHYVNRAEMGTRFDEKNCNAQCRYCNRFREGQMLGYTQGLLKKYGPGILDELRIKKNRITKLSGFEYGHLIEHYKQQVKILKEQKCKVLSSP